MTEEYNVEHRCWWILNRLLATQSVPLSIRQAEGWEDFRATVLAAMAPRKMSAAEWLMELEVADRLIDRD